jgi:hypothetical protein
MSTGSPVAALERRSPGSLVAGAALAGTAVAAVAALSLADRAPGRLETAASRMHADGIVRDGLLGVGFDTAGHAVVWAVVTGAVLLGVGRRMGLRRTAVAVFGLSLAIEVLQATSTSSRAFQFVDLTANAVGIAAAGSLAWLVRRRLSGPRPSGRHRGLDPALD